MCYCVHRPFVAPPQQFKKFADPNYSGPIKNNAKSTSAFIKAANAGRISVSPEDIQRLLDIYDSQIILADEFARLFDGFSIGSNDLTQLTLGLDRDSSLVASIYDERNDAVKELIRFVIRTAKRNKRKIGICGDAPSTFPEFAEFLVEEGIDTISVTPDSMLKTIKAIAKIENKK